MNVLNQDNCSNITSNFPSQTELLKRDSQGGNLYLDELNIDNIVFINEATFTADGPYLFSSVNSMTEEVIGNNNTFVGQVETLPAQIKQSQNYTFGNGNLKKTKTFEPQTSTTNNNSFFREIMTLQLNNDVNEYLRRLYYNQQVIQQNTTKIIETFDVAPAENTNQDLFLQVPNNVSFPTTNVTDYHYTLNLVDVENYTTKEINFYNQNGSSVFIHFSGVDIAIPALNSLTLDLTKLENSTFIYTTELKNINTI